MDLFCQKFYILFLEILEEKENKEACNICFDVRISKKSKHNFRQNDSFKNFLPKDDNNGLVIEFSAKWPDSKYIELGQKKFKLNSKVKSF